MRDSVRFAVAPLDLHEDDFDDRFGPPVGSPLPAPLKISATPFVWRDPKTFPKREWLYGTHLIRKFLSCTVAPGGVGKTSLILVEAVAMATGRNLLGIRPASRLKVWVCNLEDPREEIERRILAICLHHMILPEELDGQLFIDSGREISLVVATTTRNGTEIATPVVEALTAEISARGIDVLVVDPFVKSHRVLENDNGAIDVVATAFAGVADATGIAIDLVHHVRKGHGQEITVEDGRGAVALLSAVRSARALNPMSSEEAEKAGGIVAREHFRATNGKANLAPPPDKSHWYRLRSVSLGNDDNGVFDDSDKVGVVETWQWPDLMAEVTVSDLRMVQSAVAAGRWRENHQSKDWVGHAVAGVLKLDPKKKPEKARILHCIKTWIATGMLVVVEGEDEKRMPRSFVEVGEMASD